MENNCSLPFDNCTELLLDLNPNRTSFVESDGPAPTKVCGHWEPAQHNLFQLCNFFFAAAFLIPRSYKPGIFILRALLSAGFFVQAVWSGVHVCSGDIVIWSIILGTLNLLHTVGVLIQLVPPSLSPELTELYLRMFNPLKVSRKHFKELTREASVLMLEPGEAYAVEEMTNADERLSILLRGKLKVTCDSIHLHYITSYQFIDSPEWEAGHVTSDELFQVTIIAEEESMYLCWPKLKLARVLRHRPSLKIILSNLIGKDITNKLYWLNEAVGAGSAYGARDLTPTGCQHLRRMMSRSMSADAVNTSTKGHVRSTAWRSQLPDQSEFLLCDTESPLRYTQHEWWPPVVANQFLENSPFAAASAGAALPTSGSLLPIPPMTPLAPATPITPKKTASVRRHREVKFEESNV